MSEMLMISAFHKPNNLLTQLNYYPCYLNTPAIFTLNLFNILNCCYFFYFYSAMIISSNSPHKNKTKQEVKTTFKN